MPLNAFIFSQLERETMLAVCFFVRVLLSNTLLTVILPIHCCSKNLLTTDTHVFVAASRLSSTYFLLLSAPLPSVKAVMTFNDNNSNEH